MNKDILFSLWYDSLEGTKSQGFAYKAWCAGWSAAQKESPLQEISDIGQEIEQAEKQDHLNDAMSVLHDINADLIEDAKLRERNT